MTRALCKRSAAVSPCRRVEKWFHKKVEKRRCSNDGEQRDLSAVDGCNFRNWCVYLPIIVWLGWQTRTTPVVGSKRCSGCKLCVPFSIGRGEDQSIRWIQVVYVCVCVEEDGSFGAARGTALTACCGISYVYSNLGCREATFERGSRMESVRRSPSVVAAKKASIATMISAHSRALHAHRSTRVKLPFG